MRWVQCAGTCRRCRMLSVFPPTNVPIIVTEGVSARCMRAVHRFGSKTGANGLLSEPLKMLRHNVSSCTVGLPGGLGRGQRLCRGSPDPQIRSKPQTERQHESLPSVNSQCHTNDTQRSLLSVHTPRPQNTPIHTFLP